MASRKLPDNYTRFMEAHPDVSEAFQELGRRIHASGPLSERERRLVKLGIAVGVNTEGAVHSAVRLALDGGCTADEIRHVVHLAITTLGWPRAMAALSWVGDMVPAPAAVRGGGRGRGARGASRGGARVVAAGARGAAKRVRRAMR